MRKLFFLMTVCTFYKRVFLVEWQFLSSWYAPHFFYAYQKDTKQKTLRELLWNLAKTYLCWSVLYIPYAFLYFRHLGLASYLAIPGLLIGLLYTGLCYHLWYLPAVIVGFLFLKVLKKIFSNQVVFGIIAILYLFGSMETYSAYLEGTMVYSFYDLYQRLFITSRNGIFYAPIFLYLGDLVYQWREQKILSEKPMEKALLCFLIFLIEGVVIYYRQGIDKNFFIALVPFTFFFFNAVIRSSLWSKKKWGLLKQLSGYYYFLHPLFIEVGFYFLQEAVAQPWQKGIAVTIFAIISAHFISIAIIHLKKQFLTRKEVYR